MPKKIAELPLVSCYAMLDDDRTASYERLAEAVRAGKLKAATWYIEHDAGEQANDLAGSNVRLPYFFVGDPPLAGKTWPKHRAGGAAFLERWLDGLAAREEQVGVPQAAPYAERSSEWYDEKLKDERATHAGAASKAGKELVDQNHALEVKLAEATGASQELADARGQGARGVQADGTLEKAATPPDCARHRGPGRDRVDEVARGGHLSGPTTRQTN